MQPSPAALTYDEEALFQLPLILTQSVGQQGPQEQQGPEAEPGSHGGKRHQVLQRGGGNPGPQEAPQHACVEQQLQIGGEGGGDSRKGAGRSEEARESNGASAVPKEGTHILDNMSRQWWHTSGHTSKPGSGGRSTGRWLSPEFLFYYVYTSYFYYLFFSQSVEVSNKFASVPALKPWLRGLKPGWLWGRQLDLTDHQWRTFRESLPILASAMFLFTALGRWALPWCTTALSRPFRLKPAALGRTTLIYWFLVSACLVLYLHGLATVFPAALAGVNYLLVHRLKGHRRFLGILWAYHCASFLAIRACDGFPFAMLETPSTLFLNTINGAVSLALPRWSPGDAQPLVHRWLTWADSHRGALRWHICYNLLLLRMISYACDQHWEHLGRTAGAPAGSAAPSGQGTSVPAGAGSGTPPGDVVHRSSGGVEPAPVGAPPQQASARPLPGTSSGAPRPDPPSSVDTAPALLYAVHLFFAPLYVAGPIIPYHSFVAQARGLDGVPLSDNDASQSSSSSSGSSGSHPLPASPPSSLEPPRPCRPAAVEPRALAVYLLRALLALGSLELLLHWCYFPALAASKLWRHMTTAQLCLLSYGTLNFVWLKFLTIWRLSRLWALIAGFDPPENILRCVSNNYSVQGFWRGWHASYNKWIVRYLYVPLGGARYKALNAWVVFTFVALWHDLEWKLLAWAWLMCLLLLPELLLNWAATRSPLKEWQGTALFREGTAVLGAVNILGLMLANLVGFVVGPSGTSEIAARLLAPEARPLLLFLVVSLYVGVKLMLEVREMEARNKGRQGAVLGKDSTVGSKHQVVDKREHQS